MDGPPMRFKGDAMSFFAKKTKFYCWKNFFSAKNRILQKAA